MSNTQGQENTKDSWLYGDAKGNGKISTGTKDRPDVLIGSKCFISGALQLEGTCVIDGTVEGEISSSGELIIGETAVIKARITGSTVKIHGRVVGDIDCQKKLELKSGAIVTGNITAHSLVIEDGVVYQGFCTMTQRSSLSVDLGSDTPAKGVDESGSVLELTAPIGGTSTESSPLGVAN